MLRLPAESHACRILITTARCTGDIFEVVVPSIVDGKEEFHVLELWRVDAEAEVSKEGGVATVA
jgi:hypothetical protein